MQTLSAGQQKKLERDLQKAPNDSTWTVRNRDEEQYIAERLGSMGKRAGKFRIRPSCVRVMFYPPRGQEIVHPQVRKHLAKSLPSSPPTPPDVQKPLQVPTLQDTAPSIEPTSVTPPIAPAAPVQQPSVMPTLGTPSTPSVPETLPVAGQASPAVEHAAPSIDETAAETQTESLSEQVTAPEATEPISSQQFEPPQL